MSKQSRGVAAWITLVVAATLCVALAVLLVVQLVRPQPYRISAREQAAMAAGAQEIKNNTTISRKNFDKDWALALDGASGENHDSLTALKEQTKEALTAGKFDLSGEVTSTSVKSSNHDSVLVLVSFNGYQIADDGKKTLSTTQQTQLTMKQAAGKWRIDSVDQLGLDS